ncbi:hypothetical protein AVU99_gp069 [Mycobacterium phage Lolly9]|uniref:Uncharacterized protein n=1 Tax=Mycobacterium phage Lolly9 TaxID=1698711 RepID=A0A0K2FP12_9CAUD|nr:hypothetical protein AVU99_gp069 [Mycobacterium phage Lolly9]ALA48528.1 hypothetical protein LOLLY9_121 [Mycobacterium phage Lolly9]QOP65838.1 hypothetical protein PBI_MINILON_125 [Mycobacterium phage MiniLon]QOP66584.1 hypothetical protein PBI_MINIMAC_125 [Mycobacterium phage MiniMac]
MTKDVLVNGLRSVLIEYRSIKAVPEVKRRQALVGVAAGQMADAIYDAIHFLTTDEESRVAELEAELSELKEQLAEKDRELSYWSNR